MKTPGKATTRKSIRHVAPKLLEETDWEAIASRAIPKALPTARQFHYVTSCGEFALYEVETGKDKKTTKQSQLHWAWTAYPPPLTKKKKKNGVLKDSRDRTLALGTQLFVCSSERVQEALCMSYLGINTRGDYKGRFALAMAFINLMEYAADQFKGDREQLIDQLSKTIGKQLLGALNSATGSRKRLQNVVTGMNKTFSSIVSALRQMHGYRTKVPLPGDKSRGAWTWAIQQEAKAIFRETKQRPRQMDIHRRLGEQGWKLKGNVYEERWKSKILAAGLETLPR